MTGRPHSVRGQSKGLMLVFSAILHGAIALLPRQAVPQRPEQPALESFAPITVTRLSDLLPTNPDNGEPNNSNNSQPAVLQPVPPPAAPPSVPPQPIAAVESSPVPAQTISELPIEESAVNTQTATEDTVTENVATENPAENEENNQQFSQSNESSSTEPLTENSAGADAAKTAIIWEGFLDSLPSGLAGSNLQQILSLFGQPGQEELFFDDHQQPKTSVVSHHLLENKTPDQVFEELVYPQFQEQQSFEIQIYGEFAGGPVYQIMQGEIVHYLNIVPLARDSVLIVSDRPPDA